MTIRDHSRHMIDTISQTKAPKFNNAGPRGYMLILVQTAPTIVIAVATHLR